MELIKHQLWHLLKDATLLPLQNGEQLFCQRELSQTVVLPLGNKVATGASYLCCCRWMSLSLEATHATNSFNYQLFGTFFKRAYCSSLRYYGC